MLISIDNPIEKRSTGELTTPKMKPILDALGTSKTLRDYDRKRTEENGIPKFSAVQMMVILFFMEIRKCTFSRLHEILDGRNGQRILKSLGMPMKDGRYIHPCNGWISDFRNHHYPQFRDEFMAEMQKMVICLKMKNAERMTADSTPLEASRYSETADFNPHYRIKMAKAHMIMVDGIPLYSSVTNGNRNDNPELLGLLRNFDGVKVSEIRFLADGGYDSFETYAEVYRSTGCVMYGNTGVNGIYHEDAEWKDILKAYNGFHNEDDYVPPKTFVPEKILRYLLRHGKTELVGKFLRNIDIRRGNKIHEYAAKRRHICETMHHAMKRWLNFDIRGINSKFIECRVSLKIAFCTLLALLFKPYEN